MAKEDGERGVGSDEQENYTMQQMCGSPFLLHSISSPLRKHLLSGNKQGLSFPGGCKEPRLLRRTLSPTSKGMLNYCNYCVYVSRPPRFFLHMKG